VEFDRSVWTELDGFVEPLFPIQAFVGICDAADNDARETGGQLEQFSERVVGVVVDFDRVGCAQFVAHTLRQPVGRFVHATERLCKRVGSTVNTTRVRKYHRYLLYPKHAFCHNGSKLGNPIRKTPAQHGTRSELNTDENRTPDTTDHWIPGIRYFSHDHEYSKTEDEHER